MSCWNANSQIIKCTVVDNYDLGAALKLYIAIVSLLVETFEQAIEISLFILHILDNYFQAFCNLLFNKSTLMHLPFVCWARKNGVKLNTSKWNKRNCDVIETMLCNFV